MRLEKKAIGLEELQAESGRKKRKHVSRMYNNNT